MNSFRGIESLVVGVDGSEEAGDALSLVRLLAARLELDVHVVAVLPGGLAGSAFESPHEEQEASDFFERVIASASIELGEGFTSHRVVGVSAPAGLTAICEETGASGIVIGSSAHGPIGRVLMGDVGGRLASGSSCPVFVAPRGYSRQGSAGLGRIGVGFNGSPESRIALDYATGLAGSLGSSLNLIGAVPLIHAGGRIGHTGIGYQQLIRDQLETSLTEATTAAGDSGLEVSHELRTGDPADCLVEATSDLDLLVLGSRGYGPLLRVMLGGVSLKAMRSSACPVIVVPRGG